MRAIAYLTEPASYTIDLIKKVHIPAEIDFKFLQTNTSAKSKSKLDVYSFLSNYSWKQRILILRKDYKNYDAIVFNGYDRLDFLFLLLIHFFAKTKKPIGLESDTQLRIPKNFFKRVVKKIYLNVVFKDKYIHALAGGNNTHKELFRYYGMKEEQIHFLPMVIDVSKFEFDLKRKRADKFTFLFVGRFISLKQIELVIQEFITSFEHSPDVELHLVGDGVLYESLKATYNTHKNVIFFGALFGNELIERYNQSHTLILASNKEQWGLVLNEALSSGLSVISNNKVGANYDLIVGKGTGLIFDSEIKNDLSKKMKLIYEDKALFKKQTKNAYDLMHEYWNYNLYQRQLLKAFQKMTNLD